MANKFKGRYKNGTNRVVNWDYGSEASYFITICISERNPLFGKLVDGGIILSEIGEIVKDEWVKTPSIRPDMNLTLAEYVVMPDHFHAIISIGKNQYNESNYVQSLVAPGGFKNKFGAQKKNLASILRGFKSAVTIRARRIDPGFKWQPGFNDHIIKNKRAFFAITTYIRNNSRDAWNSGHNN